MIAGTLFCYSMLVVNAAYQCLLSMHSIQEAIQVLMPGVDVDLSFLSIEYRESSPHRARANLSYP